VRTLARCEAGANDGMPHIDHIPGESYNYAVRSEDFQVLLLERARKLAGKMHKPPRRPCRKPSAGSNLILGVRFPGR
jgi:hypothetical protein